MTELNSFSFGSWLSNGGEDTLRSTVYSTSYQRAAYVYAAINAIATTASSAPLEFYTDYSKSEKYKITDPNHPVVKLFNPPNPPFIPSLRELLFRTFIILGTTGRCFWIFTKKNGVYSQIDIRLYLEPIYKDENFTQLSGWRDTLVPGKNRTNVYTIDQVLPIVYFNPSDMNSLQVPITGLTPLSACRVALESELSINAWNQSSLKTGSKNPVLIKSKRTLSVPQKKALRDEVSNYYSGIEAAHGALIVSGDIEVTAMSLSQKDIDFVEGRKFNREEILSIFGVPPALVGIFEYASYANTREQRKIFWENTLLPKMSMILDLIQVNILSKNFPGIYAKWDVTNIYGLKPDPADCAPAAKVYFDMGIPLDDIATILGISSLAGLKLEPRGDSTSGSGSGNGVIPQPTNRRPNPNLPMDNPGDPSNVLNPKKEFDEIRQDFVSKLEKYLKSFAVGFTKNGNLEEWKSIWNDYVFKDILEYSKIHLDKQKYLTLVSANRKILDLLIDGTIKAEIFKNFPNKLADLILNSLHKDEVK